MLAASLVALAALLGGSLWLWTGDWTPLVPWNATAGPVLVFEGQRLARPPLVEGDDAWMAFPDFQERIDPKALWDEEAGLLILTTENRLITFARDAVTAFVNEEPTPVALPVRAEGGEAYVPLASVASFYGIAARYEPSTRTAVVDRASSPVLRARAERRLELRTEPSRFASRLGAVDAGTVVRVFGEERGYYRVRLEDGRLGYLPKEGLVLTGLLAGTGPSPAPPAPFGAPVDLPLDLTWDLVGAAPARPASYPDMPGVNVISPTWLHLGEGGLVTSRADPAYVEAAHERGWAVWPLFGNNFDPDLTHEVLSDSRLRLGVTRQLLLQARLGGFDGINVDWENMNPDDRDLFTQFLRELAPLAHQAGLAVSVDVTFPGPSAFWQKPYDRAEIGRTVDYVVMMGYDQYTAGSATPGPVSGFPWVEAGVSATLKEVPADRLVLGVPFYTRIWTRVDGELRTRAVGIANAKAYLAKPGATVDDDDPHGLPRVTWREGGEDFTMWAETPDTLRRRASLAREFGLAGVASWQRIFADRDAWTALQDGLRGR